MTARTRRMAAGATLLVTLLVGGCAATSASSPTTSARTMDAVDTITRDGDLVVPDAVHIGDSTVDQARPVVLRAQQLYTFWNTGDTEWLDQAVDDGFRDNTLPTGRPQGPTGPAFASAQFRAAVPDLACALDDLYVTGDTFTARLTFTGHFTGTYDGVAGAGQEVSFTAIDIQHVGPDGKIVEDWHLEDNLTFLQQIGVVASP